MATTVSDVTNTKKLDLNTYSSGETTSSSKSSCFSKEDELEDTFTKTSETKKKEEDKKTTSKSKSSKSTSSSSGEKSADIQKEIDKLEASKKENTEKMKKIEEKIEALIKEAQDEIANAVALQEKMVEEHEEEVKKVVKTQLNAYVEANKNGEGMSRSKLQSNISNAMPDKPQLAEAIASYLAASEIVDEIDGYVTELGTLIADTKKISSDIDKKQSEYETAKEKEEEAKRCDPIGFVIGEGESQVQYDFIVDDGAFDSTSDFLGADNQWSSMEKLDENKDGVVNAGELKAGNIKAVKTDSQGKQSIVDLADEFGEDFSINLGSYMTGGSHSAIDTALDSNNNGDADQSLLGTFSLNAGGKEVQGYNTLDECEWLSTKYNISSDSSSNSCSNSSGTCEAGNIKDSAKTAETTTESTDKTSDDIAHYDSKYKDFSEMAKKLREQIENGLKKLSVSEEQIAQLHEVSKEAAKSKSSSFLLSLSNKTKTSDLKDTEKVEETPKAEEGVTEEITSKTTKETGEIKELDNVTENNNSDASNVNEKTEGEIEDLKEEITQKTDDDSEKEEQIKKKTVIEDN